jgi:hypothetical protein
MGRDDPEGSIETVEIYGEYVKPFDLIIAFVTTLVAGVLFYIVAPVLLGALGTPAATRAPLTITIGLIGASIGFLLTLLFIKPKRVIEGAEG